MFSFLKEITEMPYHIRKKVLDRFYTFLMYFILVLVLFPIVWMFYNSFMGNTDIVQGKLFFQRAPSNVLLTEKINDKLFIGTSDGSLNLYDLAKKKFIDRKSFGTSNTNFATDSKYIWISSADKGLIRINKTNLGEIKTAQVDWAAKLDFNKISKTLISIDENAGKVWLTLGYQDFDKIVEIDRDSLKVNNSYNILDSFPYTYEKLSISNIFKVGKVLYILTNRGIALLNTDTGLVVKVIENLDFTAAEVRNVAYDPVTKLLYFNSLSKLYSYDSQKHSFRQIFTTISDENFEQMGSMALSADRLLVGTGQGLIVLSKAGQKIIEIMDPMFDDINKDGKLIKAGKYVNSEVISIFPIEQKLYLGTSSGRLTVYDLAAKKVEQNILITKKAHFLVHWRNYIDLFHNINFGLYLRNSFIICGLTAFISMFLATITAYSLVRFDFPGKGFLSNAILSTQMIPSVMTLIPIYIMFVKFTEITGIAVKGTFWGMIFVYSSFFLPFSIWILRGFFASIPVALEEAATIDGCTPWQIFWRIAIPLSIPGIVATGIYIFLVAWDELIFAWILSNAQTMTIPVGIRLFVGNFQNRYDLLMAASTVSTLPVLFLFILLQKQIVAGLTSGGVKD